jgi:hypothetical protein
MNDGTISDNTFKENFAGDDAGGLRMFISTSHIEDNEFIDNYCYDDGGAAKFSHGANYFVGNYLAGNEALSVGGGLELDNDNTAIEACEFYNNSAEGGGGGLHAAQNTYVMNIINNVFESNFSNYCGGAIQLEEQNNEVTISQVSLLSNKAQYGGGICVLTGNVDVSNLVVSDNEATKGGGMYLKNVSGKIANIVVDDNEAGTGAGMAIRDSTQLKVVNSIVTNNNGVGVDVQGHLSSWSYSNVYGNTDGRFSGFSDPTGDEGNIAGDPGFVSAGTDYQLLTTSVCVDAGDPSITDWDGTTSDMGAYGGPSGAWP